MYQYILFDLDGTLTDSQLGITRCVAFALEHFGIHVDDPDRLRCFIGPPLKESFEKFYGLSPQDAQEAVTSYRQRFAPIGKFENSVYEGIPQLLAALKSRGKTLIVATSKPTTFTLDILEHFELSRYFDLVVGSELDGSLVNKDEVIAKALTDAGIGDKAAAVMVGDREHDILGARENGLDSIGVLYGFGSREELEAAGAGRIAESVAELEGLLL